jgi:uncharacterized protein DUF4398
MRWIEAALFASSLSFVALFFPACGGAPPLPPTIANAEANIRTAQELGASKDPQGALHLNIAQEELDKAKKLYTAGDPKNGDLALGRAAVDAELALAEAREAQSQAQMQQIVDQAKLIKAQQH